MHLLRRHQISFKHAFEGIIWATKTQPNFRIHLFLSFTALFAGWLLRISYTELILIVLTIVFGLGCEMINTSIEAMTDLITLEYRQQAKIAKDVAAGMMLLTAFGAIGIALLIFLPKILFIFFK
jgi:diacylglycerol kinase (ATP)